MSGLGRKRPAISISSMTLILMAKIHLLRHFYFVGMLLMQKSLISFSDVIFINTGVKMMKYHIHEE